MTSVISRFFCSKSRSPQRAVEEELKIDEADEEDEQEQISPADFFGMNLDPLKLHKIDSLDIGNVGTTIHHYEFDNET